MWSCDACVIQETASHGVDGVQQPRPGTPQPPCTTEPIPQLAGSYTAHTGPSEPMCSCSGLFRGKKNVQIIITLEYNANQKKKKKKIQSAQSREAISTCGHTLLPCFTPKGMTFVVHISIQLALFAVPWNSHHHCVAICKAKGKTVIYSPIKTDC